MSEATSLLNPVYVAWASMKQRCLNPNHVSYSYYGGRGIGICEGFLVSNNFLEAMSPKPAPEYTLDRIDNNGHYSCGECDQCIFNNWPKNVRWITQSEQNVNRRPYTKKKPEQGEIVIMATDSARGGTLTAKANGTRLKQLRGDRKQSEIEDQCEIPHGQLTRFETGKPVGIKYLLTLASFYEVEAASLLSEEGLRTTGELLTDLAKLRGVKIDFGSSNGGGHMPPPLTNGASSEPMVL